MGTIQMLAQLQQIKDDACLREHLLHSALALISTLLGEDPHAQEVQLHLALCIAWATLVVERASACCSSTFYCFCWQPLNACYLIKANPTMSIALHNMRTDQHSW